MHAPMFTKPWMTGRTRNVAYRAAVMVSAVVLGCGSGREESIGPCNVIYLEPLIQIDRVLESASGLTVPRVFIREIVFQTASPVSPNSLIGAGVPSRNVTVEGDRLVCDIACGFGSAVGAYAFTLQATGYRDTLVTINATYARGHGNCPAVLSGGQKLVVEMRPL